MARETKFDSTTYFKLYSSRGSRQSSPQGSARHWGPHIFLSKLKVIKSPLTSVAVTVLPKRTKVNSVLLSADVSSKVSTTELHSPRFRCVPEQSGMRPFPLLAPWERFPQPVSVLHDHSRQHVGTHCLAHSPTYTAGLTMEQAARGHGCPYNTSDYPDCEFPPIFDSYTANASAKKKQSQPARHPLVADGFRK